MKPLSSADFTELAREKSRRANLLGAEACLFAALLGEKRDEFRILRVASAAYRDNGQEEMALSLAAGALEIASSAEQRAESLFLEAAILCQPTSRRRDLDAAYALAARAYGALTDSALRAAAAETALYSLVENPDSCPERIDEWLLVWNEIEPDSDFGRANKAWIQGLVLRRLGRVPEALSALRHASDLYSEGGYTLWCAMSLLETAVTGADEGLYDVVQEAAGTAFGLLAAVRKDHEASAALLAFSSAASQHEAFDRVVATKIKRRIERLLSRPDQ